LIAKDASGEPTGELYNHRAMDVVRHFAPPISDAMMRQSILDAQSKLIACGVTTIQDNNIRNPEEVKAYQELSKSGQFILRNNQFLTMEWPQDLKRVDQVDFYQDQQTRFSGFKFLIDGQVPTAFCHEAHDGQAWNISTWEAQSFKDAVRTLHDTGLQVCVHCVGDAAADLALDAFEDAMNANPRPDPRHRLEHAVLTTPEATRRIKDLGVVVSTNPQFIYLGGDSYEGMFGEQRAKRVMVTREWLENGIPVTIGSDCPSTIWYDPQTTIGGGMTRLTYSKKIYNQEQCLTFEEALRAQTYDAAYASHQENEKGSLEPGKLADIAVWPGDPSRATLAELLAMDQMDLTLIGGKVVHGTI
jgi:predicted amidohydrolase YtcJ